jgi:hypothetical protein
MIDRQFLFSPANETSMILPSLYSAPIGSRKMSACSTFQGASPRFRGLHPIRILSAIFFIVQQTTMFKFFFRQAHRFPITWLRTKSITLGLLVWTKLLLAHFADIFANPMRLKKAFARTKFIALLGNVVFPCFSTDRTCAILEGGSAPAFAGTELSLADSGAARRDIEFFMTGRALFSHVLSILSIHLKVKRLGGQMINLNERKKLTRRMWAEFVGFYSEQR